MIERNLGFANADPAATAAGATKGETVIDWSERWMRDRVDRKIVETDRHDCGRLKKHIWPAIGTLAMADVPRQKIEAIVLELDRKVVAGEMSSKTAQNTWGVLSTSRALTHGEGLPRHVARNVARVSLRWRRAFALAIYLQVRAGELRPLRGTDLTWLDEEMTSCIVSIHKATKRDTSGKIEKRTKTGITRRFEAEPAIVPLLRALWEALPDRACGSSASLTRPISPSG